MLAPSHHTLYPNPAMQLLYCSTKDLQSEAGSDAFENSMHSSRFDFSSLHTQHGYSQTVSDPQGKMGVHVKAVWNVWGGGIEWFIASSHRRSHLWFRNVVRPSDRSTLRRARHYPSAHTVSDKSSKTFFFCSIPTSQPYLRRQSWRP